MSNRELLTGLVTAPRQMEYYFIHVSITNTCIYMTLTRNRYMYIVRPSQS